MFFSCSASLPRRASDSPTSTLLASNMEAAPARESSLQEKDVAEPSSSKVTVSTSENQDASSSDTNTYLHGFKIAVVMLSLCLCNFLVALDTTIIATAIPVISERFHALQDVGWYVSAYFLTNCAFQLFYGKLYTLYDVKWIYMGAVAIFEIGSLICAVAPNSPVFIFGRAVAGLGGAGTFSGCKSKSPLVRPTFEISGRATIC